MCEFLAESLKSWQLWYLLTTVLHHAADVAVFTDEFWHRLMCILLGYFSLPKTSQKRERPPVLLWFSLCGGKKINNSNKKKQHTPTFCWCFVYFLILQDFTHVKYMSYGSNFVSTSTSINQYADFLIKGGRNTLFFFPCWFQSRCIQKEVL